MNPSSNYINITLPRVAQTVFLVNRLFVPCQKRARFDENGENDEFAFYPLKTMVSLLRPPQTTKMTKMAGVTQEKAWLRESRVCSSLNYRHPQKHYIDIRERGNRALVIVL